MLGGRNYHFRKTVLSQFNVYKNTTGCYPAKHEVSTQDWFKFGLALKTSGQH